MWQRKLMEANASDGEGQKDDYRKQDSALYPCAFSLRNSFDSAYTKKKKKWLMKDVKISRWVFKEKNNICMISK